jgi:hypothetical protein
VDEATGRIDVLDEVNARVLTYDAAGKRVAATPIATRSTTVDDIVREPDGTRVLFDATRGQITHLTAHGQETVAADFADAPANARLATDGDAVFVRDAADGSLRSVAGARRHDGVRAVLDRGSVLVAPIGGRGVRVDLGRPALDVVGSETDGTDVLWALVDLDDGTMRLVSVDLGHPDVVTARVVDASVFGDVTRRLVALDSGAAVMSATATDVSFTRYAR